MKPIRRIPVTPNDVADIEAAARRSGRRMTTVCRSAGVNYSTWWRLKRGRVRPMQETLDALRSASGI